MESNTTRFPGLPTPLLHLLLNFSTRKRKHRRKAGPNRNFKTDNDSTKGNRSPRKGPCSSYSVCTMVSLPPHVYRGPPNGHLNTTFSPVFHGSLKAASCSLWEMQLAYIDLGSGTCIVRQAVHRQEKFPPSLSLHQRLGVWCMFRLMYHPYLMELTHKDAVHDSR